LPTSQSISSQHRNNKHFKTTIFPSLSNNQTTTINMKISFTSILACSALFGGVFAAPTSLPEASLEERQISSQLLGVVQNLFTNIQTITTQIGTSLE
jgi:hypothetical protein